ncbi:hypothetical protein P152DRAFT_408592, partial [Eremomyces bilateralis CBS 781.70]
MSDNELTPSELDALLDILVHNESYAEIERFKYSGAIKNYGPPFHIDDDVIPSSPILQTLVSRFLLTLPGLRDVSEEFWKDRIHNLIEELGDAELSESYDKGSIGARRTLSTAIATLLEYPAKGVLHGLPKEKSLKDDKDYDATKADDLFDAFHTFLHQIVHGDMIDQLFEVVAHSDKVEDHSPLVQTAHEFLLVNLASFLHYITVLSPDGQFIMKILSWVHRLIPYTVVRQTLRIGNAATMIGAMVKLVLTKMSLGSITNWMGWSKGADEGMNLMQQIVSTVISWDLAELQKQAAKAERTADGQGKVHLSHIKEHIEVPREEREKRRQISQNTPQSIIATIISEATEADVEDMTPEHHDRSLEYLDLQMSMRDRTQISRIFCTRSPDILTPTVKDVVSAYDPIIRAVHNAVDLSGTLSNLEAFLTDFIKLAQLHEKEGPIKSTATSRPSSQAPSRTASPARPPITKPAPSVKDFIGLLRKHQNSLHKFLHQVAHNGPEVASWYRDYVKSSAAQFKPSSTLNVNIKKELQGMFNKLQDKEKDQVRKDLDDHAAYIQRLQDATRKRMQEALDGTEFGEDVGPGMYLARWKELLDATLLTPLEPKGPLRKG